MKRKNVRTASVVYYRDIRTHIVIFILIFFGILSIIKNILLGDYASAINSGMKFLAILTIRFGLYITAPITDISIYSFSIIQLFNLNLYYIDNIIFGITLILSFRDMLRARKYLFTDSLTGLLNRRYFVEIIPKVIKLKEYVGKEFGLIVLDLDNFKPVNDNFGHKSGDYVLRKTGEIINNSIRKSDLAIRYGGDEFVVLVNAKDEKVLDGIIKRIDEKIRKDLYIYNVSISAGKSIKYKDDNISLDEMFEKADKNMYENKKRRKNAR
ncbi:diguanylate cyclase (GGDEF) domain-containing protein [Marinitoga hydrogenitolerans DSM 16785]|uniref:Diguanylate cyclase (GGDEF) domain-containing protein n=1 Tax=Marinitoga hydrogenitolerans (strain DSM 16785 / JCM 12826 / AT1271) TaxID=1122195 RepID=A0A1M4US68_MARH1|nr:GGDEF domain-containing protein [Marinitoga hydrogenitolerans]SHE59473.1 diguanylate cyclase (GGDEF) domain-containing protein [Marinitoga hydrogenitolerans DSM 16785]